MTHKKHKGNPFSNEENQEINTEEKNVEEVEEIEKNDENKLQEDFDNLNNQYLRLAADFDNFRKRQTQERENLLKYGAEETMKKLLEVLDNFDRGQKAMENVDDCTEVKNSFNLVCNQMYEILKKLGLETINADGDDFDPNYHEAVMRTPSTEVEENHVISTLQKGYKLGDKVLRPALVNVATTQE